MAVNIKICLLRVIPHSVPTFQSNLPILAVITTALWCRPYYESNRIVWNVCAILSHYTALPSQMAAIFRVDIAGEWFFLSLYQWLMCLGPFGLPWVGATLDFVSHCNKTNYESEDTSGVPRNFVRGGGFNKFSWGQRTERTGIWGRYPPSQGFWRQL
jgi:hypothetical protein